MDETYEITPLLENDIVKFAPSYAEYFNDEEDKWTEETAYRRLHQMWSIEDSLCFKATIGSEIVAVAMGYMEFFDTAPDYHIFEVLVLREYQNQGIGTALINRAIECARAKGSICVSLESLNDARHQKLYKTLGFTVKEDLLFWKKAL